MRRARSRMILTPCESSRPPCRPTPSSQDPDLAVGHAYGAADPDDRGVRVLDGVVHAFLGDAQELVLDLGSQAALALVDDDLDADAEAGLEVLGHDRDTFAEGALDHGLVAQREDRAAQLGTTRVSSPRSSIRRPRCSSDSARRPRRR